MDYNKKTNKLEIAQEKIITKNVIGGSDGCQVLKTEQILFVASLPCFWLRKQPNKS